MKTKPILFSTPMVQAILAGRKTQTRRIVKCGNDNCLNIPIFLEKHSKEIICRNHVLDQRSWEFSPYGKIGDLVWVRETHGFQHNGLTGTIIYKADNTVEGNWQLTEGWKPSIFMKRMFSRITLKITDIRVERLCAISERDALAEGVCLFGMRHGTKMMPIYHWNYGGELEGGDCFDMPEMAYLNLWEHINGKGSSGLNPFVWVVEFEVHKMNIDDYINQQELKNGTI